MQHRDKRVADAIKDNVAEIITNEIADPGVGFVTVTRCSITRDLKHATVYLTIMGSEARQREALAHLEHAKGYVRRRLGERVKFRVVPELRFLMDDVLMQEMRVNEIIAGLHRDETDTTAKDS